MTQKRRGGEEVAVRVHVKRDTWKFVSDLEAQLPT